MRALWAVTGQTAQGRCGLTDKSLRLQRELKHRYGSALQLDDAGACLLLELRYEVMRG